MEAEVVAMVLSMYNHNPEEGAGTMTSGGTEVSMRLRFVTLWPHSFYSRRQ
jgi:hypothetical protein